MGRYGNEYTDNSVSEGADKTQEAEDADHTEWNTDRSGRAEDLPGRYLDKRWTDRTDHRKGRGGKQQKCRTVQRS